MDYRAPWNYERIDASRVKLLSGGKPYSELMLDITNELKADKVSFLLDEGRYAPVTGAIRPIFYVTVDDDLADQFFNGMTGYRAQFYKSPKNGLAGNRYAMAKLEQALLQEAQRVNFQCTDPNDGNRTLTMTEEAMIESLRLPSAKIWGDESQGELQEIVSQNQNDEAQIMASRWVRNAQAGSEKARKGIKAPRLSTLKFHGGFIADGIEKVPLGKVSRSDDLYFWGFS